MAGALHGVLASLKAAAASATDTFFRYVSLLLNTTGTNGAQNNTFLDSSTNAFSITRNGNTTQGTFSPFSQTGWSNFFDGSGDYFTVANNAAFNMGTSDFTLEAFVYLTATPGAANPLGGVIVDKDGLSGTSWPQYALIVDSNRKAVFQASSVPNPGGAPTAVITGATTLVLNTWYHIAATRVGTAATLWINGVSDGTTNVVPATLNSATRSLFIGWTDRGAPDSTYNFPGYISNLRIVKGTAVYTSNFTPPTAPLTAITNTSLLTCQSNRFIDNSSNAFAITRNGDVSVQAFSPFAPTAAWSASTNGGSGYFDGTGDFLDTPNNSVFTFGTANFTIEAWVYTGTTTQTTIIERRGIGFTTGDWALFLNDTTNLLSFYAADINVVAPVLSGSGFVYNAWNHVAVVRSGSNFNLYINGVSVSSATSSTSIANNSLGITIGRDNGTGGRFFWNGYISNLRIVNGTAVYTSNFTPPTAPLTAITNTSLLLNFTNAGIYDSASGNDLETVGNAQVSTVQAKWGTTSLAFDGTDDRLVMPASPKFAFGTGDFTIEGWVRRSDTNVRGIFQLCGTAGGLSGLANLGLAIGSDTGQVWRIYANNTGYNSTATWAINTWYHFALVKTAGNIKLYVDGTAVITQTDTTNYTGQNLCVGGFYDTTFLLNGYIDDLRITNGIARYTSNFTAPTAAFPIQ